MFLFKSISYRAFITIFPELFHKIQHYRIHRIYGTHNYWANLKRPETFNEKTICSKIRAEHEKYFYLADKALVKEWVQEKIGTNYIIPTYAIFQSENEISLNKFRFPCILKPTHLSGKTIILKNLSDLNENNLKKITKKWLKMNHFSVSGESQYKNIKPKIICEKLLTPSSGKLNDYKFWCFNGQVELIQVDLDRKINHKRNFFDINWNRKNFSTKYNMYYGVVEKPDNLNEMIFISETLSKGFKFVRVDLYSFDNNIYFGEITFHHGSGYEPFTTYKDDLIMGSLYNL